MILPLFLLLPLLSSFSFNANAFIPNRQVACDDRRQYGPPSTFQADCRNLANLLSESKNSNTQDLLRKIIVIKPGGSARHRSYIRWNLCWFFATTWVREENAIEGGAHHKVTHDEWLLLWTYFTAFFNNILRTCVEMENVGGTQTLKMDESKTYFAIFLHIINNGHEAYADLVTHHAETSSELDTSSALSNQSFAPPLLQSMSDDVALEMNNDVTSLSDVATQESICPWCPSCWTSASYQSLRQDVCHWCSSCWSTSESGWTRRIAILAALGTWGGPVVADRINALWSYPTDPNAAAQLAASQLALASVQSDLGRCTEQLADFVARLAAWKEAHPGCPGPNL